VRDGNFEQVIILVVVMLAWLVNFVLDQVRTRRRPVPQQDRDENLVVEEEEIDPAEATRPQVVVSPPLPDSRGVLPEPSPRQALAPRAIPSVRPRVPPRQSPARSPASRRLRRRIDPLEARRGVVLMTILGPCRGVEPPAGNAFNPLG
jgi:hypothetical protein